MTDRAICARNLSCHFGAVKAVEGLDLTILKGQIYGFLGPNGSGKSTTLRCLTGLLKPTTGSIEVLGHHLPRDAEALRMRIGYMTQTFSLYRDLSVFENLEFVGLIYGLPAARRRHRIAASLTRYRLGDLRKRMAATLSGGQKQRLALACASLHDPELLLLDEPTSAVDPENRRDFWESLFDLSDSGTTILVSTHYMDEAERCHRLAILQQGHKCADGTPEQLMAELDNRVLEITGDDLRQIKSHLKNCKPILSCAQQGTHLRVLLARAMDHPEAWLREQLASLPGAYQPRLTRPSLEDVFVEVTRGSVR